MANITPPAPIEGSKSLSTEQQVANLEQVVIGNLSSNDKLDAIFSALDNPEAKIRTAALEAVLELDDRAAIPRLQDLASRTDDPDEKQQLLDAADHLALPSLSEYVAARRAAGYIGVPQPAGPAPRRRHSPGNSSH